MLNDELALIRSIRKIVGKGGPRVHVGIGDDAAVVQSPRGKCVATIDTMVEGVHFDLTYMRPRELGHKALAINLSDMAAMAARPLYALVSIGLKQELSTYFVEELYEGLRSLAKKYSVDIIGGNTVQSPTAILIDVALFGESSRPVLRSGAKLGDIICVTGTLGDSAAGLNLLKKFGRNRAMEFKGLVERHLVPVPRVAQALKLKPWINAAIDLSDGLSVDLHHVLSASRVGAVIDSKKIPMSEECKKAGVALGTSATKWALCGGEDYELLLTIPPRHLKRCQKLVRLTPIGEITKGRNAQLIGADGKRSKLLPLGWNHFVRRAI